MPDISPNKQLNPDPNKSEPLAGPGVLIAALSAVMGLLVTFGLKITPAEQGAILTAVSALAPIALWIWGRRKVFSPATVYQREKLIRRGSTG